MKLSFAQVANFVAKWRKLRLTDEDLQALERSIAANPKAAPIMQGTGGLRKLRFAPPSWNVGKRGATRVCYVMFSRIATVYLIAVFAKNEQQNLSNEEKNTIRKWIGELEESLEA